MKQDDSVSRGSWGGRFEFILTCVGYAVGLGNVWRFPYLCYQNGGGAFLIPYTIMLFLVGLPIFFLEMCFGQFCSLGPIAAWKISPFFKGIGYAMVIVTWYISVYFNVIISWILRYLVASFTLTLPWTSCDNEWNSERCANSSVLLGMNSTKNFSSPSEEFFYANVLGISDGIDSPGVLMWPLVLLLMLTWAICFVVLVRGISSVGKVAYVVSIAPYIILTVILIRGALLPGSLEGIKFYMNPDFSRLTDFKVWGDAASQIFYSLGCATGNLIAMSSFNNFRNNIFRDSLIVPFINCLTSVFAGFVVFAFIGYMAHQKGVNVEEVAASGPGLVFIVYPEGLGTMPGAPFWSVLFFTMMLAIGFSSQFSQCEGICVALTDEFPIFALGKRPAFFRLAFCIVGFFASLPMVTQGGFYLFAILDEYGAGYTMFIIGLLELIAISWVYSYKNFEDDIRIMLGFPPCVLWRVCWLVVTPCIILIVIILKGMGQEPASFGGQVYPGWAQGLAWSIAAFPMAMILLFMLWGLFKNREKKCGAFRGATTPTADWGPVLVENRTGKYSPLKRHLLTGSMEKRMPNKTGLQYMTFKDGLL